MIRLRPVVVSERWWVSSFVVLMMMMIQLAGGTRRSSTTTSSSSTYHQQQQQQQCSPLHFPQNIDPFTRATANPLFRGFCAISRRGGSQSPVAVHEDEDEDDDIPGTGSNQIWVIGSANVDSFFPVDRLPTEGENIMCIDARDSGQQMVDNVPGGKGCTQAIAAAKLLATYQSNSGSSSSVAFVGQVGADSAGDLLLDTLREQHVDVTHCLPQHASLCTGRGYVFSSPTSVSAVVVGGANKKGWGIPEEHEPNQTSDTSSPSPLDKLLQSIDNDHHDHRQLPRMIMLQREIPEWVNQKVAQWAKKKNVLILQDVGGDDRPITPDMCQLCDWMIPNESELIRLVESSCSGSSPISTRSDERIDSSHDIEDRDYDQQRVIDFARQLQRDLGARNVLVTRGSKGCILIPENGKREDVIVASAISIPEGKDVIDETGAGDCFRAAFAVALLSKNSSRSALSLEEDGDNSNDPSLFWLHCLRFANAAGCCAVQVQGAVPSTPTRAQVNAIYQQSLLKNPIQLSSASASSSKGKKKKKSGAGSKRNTQKKTNKRSKTSSQRSESGFATETGDIPSGGSDREIDEFPFLIGSRLNSMKDRPDLDTSMTNKGRQQQPAWTTRDFVRRQATVKGLSCVDFNYPQHFQDWSVTEAKEALDEAGLVAGAVCLRYPSPQFVRGAMNHPYQDQRERAIELTKEAARAARVLKCSEVVVWSAFDGYDYPFQVDYDVLWEQLVTAFQDLCDEFPDISFSLEFKPTDENTRFFTVPSTGAALLLVDEIDRPNMGLTLDVGHMLMAGENPGHSIAMVGARQKLFGVQLNDGYTRLAAEDGLMFGSVHPNFALDIMYQLRRTQFSGHIYFDTFPQRSDPILEAEYNIQQVKRFWKAAGELLASSKPIRKHRRLETIMAEHDAVGALVLAQEVLNVHAT